VRWFFDTEFDDDGRTIDLISIALVSETGVPYQACMLDGWSPIHCSEWVKENVLPHLPPVSERKLRSQVAEEICELVGEVPELWAYYADYDWVALCQLYGRMVEIPATWPKFCRDLAQLMKDRGISKGSLPRQNASMKHDALVDARWVRDAWLSIPSR
jgi:hypothetical protein